MRIAGHKNLCTWWWQVANTQMIR